jgi:hypothetical protein
LLPFAVLDGGSGASSDKTGEALRERRLLPFRVTVRKLSSDSHEEK